MVNCFEIFFPIEVSDILGYFVRFVNLFHTIIFFYKFESFFVVYFFAQQNKLILGFNEMWILRFWRNDVRLAL